MRTFVILLAIPILLVLPSYLSYSAENQSVVPPEDQVEHILKVVESFLGVLASVWISIGIAVAYLIARFTYGRKVLTKLSLMEFCLLSFIPIIAIKATFLFKDPGALLFSLSELFGPSSSVILLVAILILCTLLYFVATRTYQQKLT